MQKAKELRMVSLVMYNLSGIQKGIQAGHSVEEYIHRHGKTDLYKEYFKDHKTWIVLDGGGSKEMAAHKWYLESVGAVFSHFEEPDCNGAISAISFIDDAKEIDHRLFGFSKGFRLAASG